MPGREAWAVHSPRAHSLGNNSPRAHASGAHASGAHTPGAHTPGAHTPGTYAPEAHTPPHPVLSGEAVPSYSAAAGEAAPGPAAPVLSRRVPQANLAPELRRRSEGRVAGGDASLPDAAEARAALSRYQASRQAARAMVDENGVPAGRADEAGPEPPAAGGWS
jgi:hypothetical protein